MRELTLKLVERCDFRRNELTNFLAAKSEKLRLRDNECVLLVSPSGNQLIFVHREIRVGNTPKTGGAPTLFVHSERFRVTRGAWNPLMLANYAQHCGITLVGIKRFEEHYKHLQKGGSNGRGS